MALLDADPYADPQNATTILEILDQWSATPTRGIIAYARSGESSAKQTTHLSYRALRALATQKASWLRRTQELASGKIILIHFPTQLENITWFWAAIIAGGVPALSTPLVNNREGRRSHFSHLYRLLCDPIVITKQELVRGDFAENELLRVIAVDADDDVAVEGLELADRLTNGHSKGLTNGHTNGIPSGKVNGLFKDPSNGTPNGLSNGLSNDEASEPVNGLSHDQDHGHLNGLTNGHTGDLPNGTTTSSSKDFTDNRVDRQTSQLRSGHTEHPFSGTNSGLNNGLSNGHPIGHQNGLANGLTNGHPNGLGNGLPNGTSDDLSNGLINDQLIGHSTTHKNGVEGVAVLMLPSVSTGNAKAVCLTHQQILAAMRGKLWAMPLPYGSALLNWIALDHVASLVEIHLCAMFAGLDQIHVPAEEMLRDPLRFLRLISEHRVSRTFAPNFFLDKLQRVLDTASTQDTQGIDLQSLLYIASGGEPNNVDTCAQVTEHLVRLGVSNKNIITPGFGMTETCAGAIFNKHCPDFDQQASEIEFAALGTCVPGIEMRVSPITQADAESMPTNGLSRSAEGALEIHGPIVFEKYFNNDKATRDAFTSDGWFKTGDLAKIDDRGNLDLVGRSKELIIINGVKYLPHEIEGAIEHARITGVSPSFVVCFAHRPPGSKTEEVYVIYQHDYDPYDIEARMDALSIIIRTVVLFAGARPRVLPLFPGRLEKTSLGKLSRAKIQASLAKGQYIDDDNLNVQMLQSYREAHFSQQRDDTERTLMAVFLDTLGLGDLEMGMDTPVLDTGVSSIDLIRLKRASEKAFDIADIPMITIMTHTTLRSLATAIKGIQTCQYQGEYNPVVTLQPNGSQTPLWLIHPGIGEILVFLGLVQYFPDRPIHALRTRGFNPGEEPFDGLTEVVTTYHRALKQQQPHGPYAIAGYSYGSMLAFEIAKILEADGDTVQFLGSFNLPPHIKDRMKSLDWTAGLLHIAHFCGIITEQRSEELVSDLHALPPPEQVAKLLAESDPQRCAELALTHASLLNWTNVAWSLQKIGWEYEPTGTVSHMDIFYCQPLKVVARTREEYREKKLNRWADFVRHPEADGGLRFHEVDGEHYTMIGPEHVPKFQQTLKKALAARGL